MRLFQKSFLCATLKIYIYYIPVTPNGKAVYFYCVRCAVTARGQALLWGPTAAMYCKCSMEDFDEVVYGI